jgi:hypothetical protein
MIIVSARDVPCPVCKAGPGAKCRYVGGNAYRGEFMRYGSHNRRVWDADEASRMANILLD